MEPSFNGLVPKIFKKQHWNNVHLKSVLNDFTGCCCCLLIVTWNLMFLIYCNDIFMTLAIAKIGNGYSNYFFNTVTPALMVRREWFA